MQASKRLDLVKWSVLIFVPIILWGFYWYIGFDQTIVKYMLFLTTVGLLVYNIKPLTIAFKEKKSYDKIVALIISLILLSLITAFLYWGQSPVLTYRAAASQFCLLYFFVLKRYNVGFKDLNRLVVLFAVIYTVLWILAVLAAPMVLFGNLDEIEDNRGFFRIMQLNGIDSLCLFFFLSLVNMCDKEKNGKFYWVVLTILSYVLIFLTLSRTLIFSISLVTIVFFVIYNRKALIVLAIILAFGGYSLITNNEVVESLMIITQDQIEEKSEGNLRLVEYTQFSRLYPFHIGTTLFGNGEPHVASSYGQMEERLKDNIGFNRSDAGYVHIIVSYGIVMLYVFFYLLIKVFKQKVSFQHLAYKMFVLALFLVNVLGSVFFSYAISFMIALYALEMERTSSLHNKTITNKVKVCQLKY